MADTDNRALEAFEAFMKTEAPSDYDASNGDAWYVWKACWAAALASRPAEVDDQIPRESNDALIALAKYWKLDGDWMTCKGCRRSLIASRDGEELAHGDGCKYWDQQHPWAQLRKLITRRPAPAGAAQ